jgi:phage terminase large subunit-like protein
VVARLGRSIARDRGAALCAHRGRDRSAGHIRQGADACGIVAAGRAANGCILCWRMRPRPGLSPHRLGEQGRRACTAGSRPTRWSPKSTWAARWCDSCCARSILGAAEGSARDARQVSPRRAGGRALRAGQGKTRRLLSAAGRRDVRFRINGLSSGASPDRLDALVWAISAMLSDRYWDGPRITQL